MCQIANVPLFDHRNYRKRQLFEGWETSKLCGCTRFGIQLKKKLFNSRKADKREKGDFQKIEYEGDFQRFYSGFNLNRLKVMIERIRKFNLALLRAA